jgi:ribosomal protein S18 acetylase RimI-like enzyme
MNFEIKPASESSISELVDVINRGFEGYFVPIQFNVTTFLNMVRKDGVDLTSSRLLLANEEPAGIALLVRRGWTSRVAAMGITSEGRGKGAGSWLMDKLIQEACERGEREMVLEVIEQNAPAVHLYEKYGFEIMRRLVGFIRKDASENETGTLQEIDIREAARRISQYGLHDLPWQLSAETIAQLHPPSRAYQSDQAYIVVSNPEPNDIVIWSLLVEPQARGNGFGTQMLKSIMTQHPNKTWHIPAILPEELGKVFEHAGFTREQLSQWQMKLRLV